MTTLSDRLKHRLEVLDKSPIAASEEAGLGRDYVRDVIRGKKESISATAAPKLARVLQCSVEWLLTGDGEENFDPPAEPAPAIEPFSGGIRYGGVVEAGAFRETDPFNQEGELRMIPLAPDPRYPVAAQFAFEVSGNSMDKANMLPGMYVQAVEIHTWERIHGEPRDGRFVIVSRSRNGGPEREITVKQLRIYRDRLELVPHSSDEKHKPLVFPNPPRPEGEIEVQIVAVVISSHWLYV